MNRNFIPAEYDLPDEVNGRAKRQWLAALAAVGIILGATLALVASNETQSPVSVIVSQ
jgi:hypothetical protein